MPKNKFQEVIFTIMMVFVMVYAMICYNISLNMGGMSNEVFLAAFHHGSAGTSDPLDQRATVGAKVAAYAAKILNELWIIRIEHGVSA